MRSLPPTHETIRGWTFGGQYHQLEMFQEAAAIAERLAELRPLDARTQLFAGLYHLLYCPDLPRARADFQRALQLRPGYPEAESFLRLLKSEARSRRVAKSALDSLEGNICG